MRRFVRQPGGAAVSSSCSIVRGPSRAAPGLANDGPLPDLPDPALRQALADHNAPVHAIVIAADETWAATVDGAAFVRIWYLGAGRLRPAWSTGHSSGVPSTAVAPDGTSLTTAGLDGPLRIWEVASGRERPDRAVRAGPADTAIAPDGRRLATVGDDRSIRIWDTATGHVEAMMRVEQPIHSCVWRPDGGGLVVGGAAGLYHFTYRPGADRDAGCSDR